MSYLVTTWTKPDDDRARRSGIWRIDPKRNAPAEHVDAALDAVYWASPDPDGSSLLMLHNDRERSSMFRYTPGAAEPVSSRISSGGDSGSFLAFHPGGEYFAVANARAGWSVFRDASVPELLGGFRNVGSGPHPRQVASHPHSAVFSPDGNTLYAADLGTDQVLAAQFDSFTGTLGDPKVAYTAAPGTGPRHVLFGDAAVYMLGELGNTIAVLEREADGSLQERQLVSTLPTGFDGESHTAHLGFGPDQRTLYATNRQHDSIVAFEVLPDGRLGDPRWTPSGGGWPWHFLVTSDTRMLVANNQSDCVAVFAIAADGSLDQTDSIPVPRPVFTVAEP